jgi:hypothetical protein
VSDTPFVFSTLSKLLLFGWSGSVSGIRANNLKEEGKVYAILKFIVVTKGGLHA